MPKAPSGSSGTATSPLGFAGQLTDSESGFQDLRARLYDPATGQFLSHDTYAGSSSAPTSLYGYAYGLDNPTTNTDPSGQCPWCVTALIGGVLGASFNYGSQVVNNLKHHKSLKDALTQVDPGEIAKAGVIGLAVGATLGLAAPVLADVAVTAGAAVELLGFPGAAAGVATVVEGGLASGLAGGVQQIGDNVTHGRNWDANVGQAIGKWAAIGAAGAVLGLGLSAVSPVVGDWLFGGGDAGQLGDLGGASAADAGTNDGSTVCGAALSFSADTLVATPSGERAIGSLQVSDSVEAYNPTTGKAEAEPIQHVWLNHDHGLVDVHLTTHTTTAAASRTSGHGLLVGDDAASVVHITNQQTANGAGGETIHTTANHPWLTADRGWVQAGELRPGEQVMTLDGGTNTVAWEQVVPGQADMYNLTVAHDHTYVVDDGQAVVQ